MSNFLTDELTPGERRILTEARRPWPRWGAGLLMAVGLIAFVGGGLFGFFIDDQLRYNVTTADVPANEWTTAADAVTRADLWAEHEILACHDVGIAYSTGRLAGMLAAAMVVLGAAVASFCLGTGVGTLLRRPTERTLLVRLAEEIERREVRDAPMTGVPPVGDD